MRPGAPPRPASASRWGRSPGGPPRRPASLFDAANGLARAGAGRRDLERRGRWAGATGSHSIEPGKVADALSPVMARLRDRRTVSSRSGRTACGSFSEARRGGAALPRGRSDGTRSSGPSVAMSGRRTRRRFPAHQRGERACSASRRHRDPGASRTGRRPNRSAAREHLGVGDETSASRTAAMSEPSGAARSRSR
jgi:hypothetical protein